MTSAFEILNRFVGFGNPYGSFWFIGLEEAEEWGDNPKEDQANLAKYKGRAFPVAPGEFQEEEQRKRSKGEKYTEVYDIMSKIVVCATGENANYRDYRNTKLLQASGETFQANLFPLGKKSVAAWPDRYKDLLGIDTAQEFYRVVKQSRFPMLRKEWCHFNPLVTICFGDATNNWANFKELFELTDTARQESPEWYQIYKPNIILCPFFNYPYLPGDRIEVIGNQTRKLLLDAKRPYPH